MSGSGGGGGGSADQPIDCASVNLSTVLASPVPEVIAELKQADKLRLTLRDSTPPVIQALDQSDRVAGAIAVSNVTRLIDCMRQGYKYVAIVASVNGGEVKITVRPAAGS
jgi:hypothetical protein